MLRDFHYYAVRALAHHAGFGDEEAHRIAYASQYTDDSTEGDPISFTEGEYAFDPVRSSWLGLESFGPDVQRKGYMPFHFVPARHSGCTRGRSGGPDARRRRPGPLRC
jgi:hypothetical protein